MKPGASGTPQRDPLRAILEDGSIRSTAAILAFDALVLALAFVADAPALAVYALSFWHYGLYWLAYRHGAIEPGVFRRDAVLTKTLSLAALGYAYFGTPPHLLSLALVAGGFLLNTLAARALGAERTYYGHELAELPPRRVRAFPYSWIAHPMLIGNIAAFGGTLANPVFCEQWWPLACAHVLLNLGLLAMETAVRPLRGAGMPGTVRLTAPGRLAVSAVLAGAAGAGAGAGAALALAAGADLVARAGIVGAAAGLHMFVMFRCYTSAPGRPTPGGHDESAGTL